MRSFQVLSRLWQTALVTCAALLVSVNVFSQNTITASGKVVDANGEAVIGASVIAKGTTNGVIIGPEGTFEIRVASGTQLEVSCIGYVTKTVAAASGLHIILDEDSTLLEETVVVGYGTMKKTDVTGAMVSVGAKELTQRPTNNVFEALQGRAAGVDIRTNERPGEVGSVYIRGQRSLTASSNPLYVVDGIPMVNGSMESLNPNDIESIEILKDASATAIYGSRGANGVVLVTTKRGSADKVTVNYAGSITVEKMVDVAEWMDSSEYIDWRRAAYYNLDTSKYPSPKSPTIENDKAIFNAGSDKYAWRNIEKGWANGTWDGSKVPTTDWLDLISRTAITHEHTVSVSGGTEKARSYTSFGYLNNQGSTKGQDYERFTLKTNNDYKPFKWFNFGASINATYSKQNFGLSGAGNFMGGSLPSVYGVARENYPYAVPFDDEGNRIEFPGGDDRVKNPYGEWDLQTDERKIFRAIGSVYAQLDFGEMWAPLKGLSYRLNFGIDFRYTNRGLYVAKESYNRAGSNYSLNDRNNSLAWTLDNLIYYNRTFGGKHTVGVTLLHSADASHYTSMNMDAENLPLESAMWNNMGSVSALRSWGTGLTERQMESIMARVNYSYDNRYMITASVRRDGASQLASGHKWATFPSVALGWRIDQEHFMDGSKTWLEQLKLRLGYGVTGNAAIDPYKTKGAIASIFYPYGTSITQGYTLFDSMLFSSEDRSIVMANEDLTWEKTSQYNVGLDFSFIQGRISGVLDVYKSYTKDLLMSQALPSLLGYTKTYNNIGKTENVGFDLSLNLVPIRTRNWEWTIDINTAYTKNKITELSNGKEDDIANGWFIGKSIGSMYTYESAGLWQVGDAAEMAKFKANGNNFQPGMARPVDQNGDYKIDANYDRVIVGCTMPRWTMGFNTAVSYKGWTLSAQLYGRFGFKDWGDAPWVGGRKNVRNYDYWTEDNPGAKYTKPIFSEAGADIYYQIVDIADRSYLKVRNVSLSYTFPESMLKGTVLSGVKLYIQAKNLGSLFNGSEARDMDTGQNYYNRGFTFGANITF